MAKEKPASAVDAGSAEIVEELYVADGDVEYTEVDQENELPEGVSAEPETEEEEPEQKAAPEKKEDDDLPEEFKGKTPAQIARMYRDLHSAFGRQSNEIGELRKTHDQFIKAALTGRERAAPKKQAAPEPDISDVDVLTDPKATVAKLVENHPALRELRGAQREMAARELRRHQQDVARQFIENHPDAKEVWADPEFKEWVGASEVRQEQLLKAHKEYNLKLANDIFSTWKEFKALKHPKPAETKGVKPVSKPVASNKAARVPSAGNASPRTKGDGKQYYRRADLIKLQMTDPSKYDMMADDILLAYKEGRVK